jgi:membrane protein implicated in regulation of membrane protease activity
MNIFKGKTRALIDDHYSDAKIGRTAIVTKNISPTIPGEIKVAGSFWRAIADAEIEEGQSVVIESQESEDGLTFKVNPIERRNK